MILTCPVCEKVFEREEKYVTQRSVCSRRCAFKRNSEKHHPKKQVWYDAKIILKEK